MIIIEYWTGIAILGLGLIGIVLALSYREIYEYATGIPWNLRKFAKQSNADEKSRSNTP